MNAAAVLAAILLCRPAMPAAEARSYAAIVAEHDEVDPITAVALVDRETGWHANAISSDGRYLGLGQIAWRYRCKRGAATVHRGRCGDERRRLLDGRYNLRTMYQIIKDWRTVCRATTGLEATEAGWISAYEGAATRSLVCGLRRLGPGQWEPAPIPRVTLEILDRAEALRRQPRSPPPSP